VSFSNYGFALTPQDPVFEESFTEVKDIIFSDTSGYIVLEIPYLMGQPLVRRIRAVTASGHQILIITVPGGDSVTILSPGDDIILTKLSDSSVAIRNIITGEEWVEVLPPDFGGFDSLTLPTPQAEWQHELIALRDAYEYALDRGDLAQSPPLKWYGDMGFVLHNNGAPGCERDEADCQQALGRGFLSLFTWAAGCAASILMSPVTAGGSAALVCGLGAIPVGVSVSDSGNACECMPYEVPPPSTPEPQPGDNAPAPCPPSVCTNAPYTPPGPAMTCGCVLILRQPGYADRCVEYGCW
jgi:hypothetical protein